MKAIFQDQTSFQKELGYIEGAAKRLRSVTADWIPLLKLIEGVKVKEVKNVCKHQGGVLTEVFRKDWDLDCGEIDQVFQNILAEQEISGWHVHHLTTDRIFVNWGLVKIVLYDARVTASTFGKINEMCLGSARPALVIIPPGVWHAVQNINNGPSALLNLVDRAYQYEDPDHWGLPINTPAIPYNF